MINRFLIILLIFSCKEENTLFEKVSENTSNIRFRNDLVENEKFNLIEYYTSIMVVESQQVI